MIKSLQNAIIKATSLFQQDDYNRYKIKLILALLGLSITLIRYFLDSYYNIERSTNSYSQQLYDPKTIMIISSIILNLTYYFSGAYFKLSLKFYRIAYLFVAQLVLESFLLDASSIKETSTLIINIIFYTQINRGEKNYFYLPFILYPIVILYTLIRLAVLGVGFSSIANVFFVQISIFLLVFQVDVGKKKTKELDQQENKAQQVIVNKPIQRKEEDLNNQSDYSKLQHLIQYNQLDSTYQNIEDMAFRFKHNSFQKQKKQIDLCFLSLEILNNLSTGIALFSSNCKLAQSNKTLKSFLLSNFTEKKNIEELILNFRFQNNIEESYCNTTDVSICKSPFLYRKSCTSDNFSGVCSKLQSNENIFFKSLQTSNLKNKQQGQEIFYKMNDNNQNNQQMINSSPIDQYQKFQFQSSNDYSLKDFSTMPKIKCQENQNLLPCQETKTIKKSQYQSYQGSKKKTEKCKQGIKTQQTETSSQGQACKILYNNSILGDSTLYNSKFDPSSILLKQNNLKWKKCFICYDENMSNVLNKPSFSIQEIIQAIFQSKSQSQQGIKSDRVLSFSQNKSIPQGNECSQLKSKQQNQVLMKKCYEIVDNNTLLLRAKTARGETLFKISSYVQDMIGNTDCLLVNSQIKRASDDNIDAELEKESELYNNTRDDNKETFILIELIEINKILNEKETDVLKSYKNKMLASLSHELRTPLNCSMQLIETLFYSGLLKEEDKSMFLVPAIQSNQLLLHMINDILDFAQINNGELRLIFSEFDVRKTIQDCIQLFGLLSYQKAIPIELIIDPILPRTIRSDITRFKQVFINILSNAFKYTNQGQIVILVEYCLSKDSNIENYLKISIQDTGCGIDSEVGETIFDGFNINKIASQAQEQASSKKQRKKSFNKSLKSSKILLNSISSNSELAEDKTKNQLNTQGAGLGLSISQNLAKGLGSNRGIVFSSQINKGSTFSFFVTDRNKSVYGCMLNIRSLFNIQYYNWQTIDQNSNNQLSSSLLKSDTGISKLKMSRQSDVISDPLNGFRKNSGLTISLAVSANLNDKPKSSQNQQSKHSFLVSENSLDLAQEMNGRRKKKYEECNMEQSQLQSLRKWYQDIEKQIQQSYQGIFENDSQYEQSSCIIEETCSHDSCSDQTISIRKIPHYFVNQKSGGYLKQNNSNFQIPFQNSNYIYPNTETKHQSISELKKSPPSRFSLQNTNIDLSRNSPVLKKKKSDSQIQQQKMFLFQQRTEQDQFCFDPQQEADNSSLSIFPRIYQQQPEKIDPQIGQLTKTQSFNSTNNRQIQQDVNQEKKNEQQQYQNKRNSSENSHFPSTSLQYIKSESQKKCQKASTSILDLRDDNKNENQQNLYLRPKKNNEEFNSQQLISNKNIIKQRVLQKTKCSCSPILVVDDNDFNLFALEVRLKSYEIKADKANSGLLAIDKVQNRYINSNCCKMYDLILMDIDMPIKDGFKTTKEIVKFFKEQKVQNPPPVSACTAYVSDQERKKAFASGMKYYITKPVDSFKLEEVLLKIYNQ